MIIDAPATAPPGAPLNRPPSNDRLGGGATAAPTESPRPLDDPEEGNGSRRHEEQANTESRPGRDDAQLAARARLDAAREGSAGGAQPAPSSVAGGNEPPRGEDPFLTREEIRRLRDRLEARLETRAPAGATLRSVDESI